VRNDRALVALGCLVWLAFWALMLWAVLYTVRA
jgi:hypothetical protein